jgi:hypothetical protein
MMTGINSYRFGSFLIFRIRKIKQNIDSLRLMMQDNTRSVFI